MELWFPPGQGTKMLVVKGTVDTGMNEKTMMIALGIFDVGCFKILLRKTKKVNKLMIQHFSVSKTTDAFYVLGEYH